MSAIFFPFLEDWSNFFCNRHGAWFGAYMHNWALAFSVPLGLYSPSACRVTDARLFFNFKFCFYICSTVSCRMIPSKVGIVGHSLVFLTHFRFESEFSWASPSSHPLSCLVCAGCCGTSRCHTLAGASRCRRQPELLDLHLGANDLP